MVTFQSKISKKLCNYSDSGIGVTNAHSAKAEANFALIEIEEKGIVEIGGHAGIGGSGFVEFKKK